jgi:arabinogalactan endo-1,4-beta-galactosidase
MKDLKRLVVCPLFFSVIVHNNAISQQPKNDFVKGADIGWLPQMEATGYKFYNDKGVEEDCIRILKDHGIKHPVQFYFPVNISGK